MSLGHGTKMITDGLVAYYDVNSDKSFKGAPTTNIIHWQNAVPQSTYTPYVQTTSGTWQQNHPDAIQVVNASGSSITGYVNTGVTDYTNTYHAIWTYDDVLKKPVVTMRDFDGQWKAKSFSTGKTFNQLGLGYGDTYTISWLQWVDDISKKLRVGVYGQNTSGVNGFHDGRIGVPNTQVGKWERVYITYTVSTQWNLDATLSIYMYGYYDVRATIKIADVQWEIGSIPSKFSPNETRSDTEALVDLTNNQTIVSSALTYTSMNDFKFNGTSDSLVIPQPVSGQTYNDLTFSMWVYPESTGWILCPNSNGIDTYLRYSTATEEFTFTYVESADTTARSVGQSGISPNRWYNVTVSINDKTVKLYVNGQLKDQRTDTINIGLLTGQWYLGKRPNNTNHFGGRIGTFKVYDRTLSDREVELDYTGKAPSYPGHSPKYPAKSGYALSQIMPESNSGYYWIQNRKMPGPLEMYVDMEQEGGGYDFYVITNGINPRFVNEPNSGTELGLDLIYPRSKEHWQAAHNFAVTLGGNLNTYFSNMGAVYRTGGIGNYTSYIMRNPDYYGTGAPNWQVPDGGRWWLRDSTYTEPNGDYSAYGFLGSRGFPSNYNGEDMVFNDVYSTNSTYDTGAYRPGTTYLVSTNAKP